MIYPAFLKDNDTIGISAPSAGVGKKLEDFERSIDALKAEGWNIIETESVRVNNERSADAKTRGEELTSLFLNEDVDMVMAAAGGDFLDEMIPYADFEAMKAHPKWLMGASDPTGILYPYTVKYDVASIYGLNAGSYDIEPMPDFVKKNLEILKGNLIEQESYPAYMKTPGFLAEKVEFDTPNHWISTRGDMEVFGRCIGGCIDVLKDLIGTRFDATQQFVEKYKEDGCIWFFDNFSQSAEVFYRTLLQMKYAGWFDTTKAVIIGRTLFESSETGMTYEDACLRALGEYPLFLQADVGHTLPHMTMILGSIIHLSYKDQKAVISFELK